MKMNITYARALLNITEDENLRKRPILGWI